MFPFPQYAANDSNVVISTLSYAWDTGNVSSYTASAVPMGAEDPTRHILVGCSFDRNTTTQLSTTGLKVGTVNGTKVAEHTFAGASDNQPMVSFWVVPYPTGTSASINVTLNTAASRMGMGIWRLVGSGNMITPKAVVATSGTSATIYSPNGGGIVSMAAQTDDLGSFTFTTLTKNFDFEVEANHQFAGASLNTFGAGSYTSNITWPTTNARRMWVLTSWG
jgi:hypothetical protein